MKTNVVSLGNEITFVVMNKCVWKVLWFLHAVTWKTRTENYLLEKAKNVCKAQQLV